MKSMIMVFLIGTILLSTFTSAYAQQPQLATYRETAQVLVDEKIQNQTTAFITLSTTSPLEMRVPTALDQKISNSANVTSVAITNANSCVEGVNDQLCVIFTIYNPSLIESYNITKIQTVSRAIGDTLINDTNKSFLLNASFWSVYVQPKGALSNALGTSGTLAGNRTISVIYTAPQLKSSYLFDQLTSILLPSQIRNAGGFYEVAKKMVDSANSTVTFAITPTANNQSLYQLQVSTHSPIKGQVTSIRPLDFFGVKQLNRSSYFNGGFFPLNSLLQISILSNNNTYITNHGGNIVPTNNQGIPTDLTKSGWVFSPDSGQQVTGIYIFGTTTNATNDDLALTIGTTPSKSVSQPTNSSGTENTPTTNNSDYSTYVIIGIVAAGGGAIYLFMRRR
ncbi:MAG TPA: hypothetical protein VJ771_08325 [Candidatus Nitrosotalea sp.]|nr:hypothetical protein [Candidatus Nitrosotalea sp.]